MNPAMFLQLLKSVAVVGLQLSSKNLPSRVCEGCVIGKNHKHFFPTRIPILRVKKHIEFFHANVYMPMNLTSFGRSRYFVLFKDDFFGYEFVFNVKNKYDVFYFFKQLELIVLKNTSNKIFKLCNDLDGKFLNSEFTQHLDHLGIRHELIHHTHQSKMCQLSEKTKNYSNLFVACFMQND